MPYTNSFAICADRCVQSSVTQVFSIWKMIYKVAMIEEIPVRDSPEYYFEPEKYRTLLPYHNK